MSKQSIIIVIIILALGVGGWYVYSQNQAVNPPVGDNGMVGNSDIDTSDVAQEGWQTYRNEEYGFEIKYPPNWIAGGMLLRNQIDTKQEILFIVDKHNQQEIDIYSWIKTQKWPSPESIDSQFISFNQIDDTKAFQQRQTGTVYFVNSKYIFMVNNGISMERRIVDEELFNQILSTFKFLN